jgi:hypothetical protein
MRLVAACLLAVLTLVPAGMASTTVTYVVGAHVPPPKEMGAVCVDGKPEDGSGIPHHGVGGACGIAPSDLSSVTVTVQDLLGNPVGFYWVGIREAGSGAGNVACGQAGTGFGSVTFALDDPCAYVDVFPDATSPAGTITVS